jgi:cytochrome c oxidase subunit 1
VSERHVAWLYGGTAVAVIALMGLAGLGLRFSQAEVVDLPPTWFYRLLTLHGAGMLVGSLVGTMGMLWVVLRTSVPLSLHRMLACYASTVAGVACVLVATLAGGFGTGWTFLYPLPLVSAGGWSTWAAAFFLVGLVLVGVGFMVFCIDVLAKTTATYGGFQRALGIDFLRGSDDEPPPPQAIAGVVVAFDGLLALAAGTTIVLAELGEAIDDSVVIDALWAKNLTYFFGHTVANLIIYLAAGAIYVLVPRYAGRPWKTTKPIVVAWLATLVFVLTAFSHHLYLDFVQPRFAQYVSLTASVAASIPVAVVTAYTGLMLIWGSRYRWTLASSLLYIGFAGWVIGGVGAVIDSLIPVNFRFHNTVWVPGHFHTYMLLCVVVWVFAFVAHLLEQAAGRPASPRRSTVGVGVMVAGGFGLVGVWYVAGALGVPRRYAVQPLETAGYSLAGAIMALAVAAGFLLLLLEFVSLARTGRARGGFALRSPPPEPARSTAEPDGVPLTTPAQVGLALGAGVVGLVAFLPQVTDAVEGLARYHHLQHGAQVLLGVVLGLVLGSSPRTARRLGQRAPGVSLALAVGAPAVMLLAMIPSIYGTLDENAGRHMLYHLAMVLLGFLAGFGCAGLGRVTGRLVALATVAMALMYAAGVTGG